jgi:hypothetical protein
MAYPAPFQLKDIVIVTAKQQNGTITDVNEDGSFMVEMLSEDGRPVVEEGKIKCKAFELLREDNLKQYIIYEHEGGADIGVTSFILNSTVAMIVFDMLSVTATLAYETPVSRDAVVSAIFSLIAGFYGMLGKNVPQFNTFRFRRFLCCNTTCTGRRNDLKEMNVAATAEQRKKLKNDKAAEKKRTRNDKKTLNELQKQDKDNKGKHPGERSDGDRNLSFDGNNPMPRTSAAARVIIGDTTTNPIGAADSGSSSQKFNL